MAAGGTRLLRSARSRAVRSLAALTLTASVVSTGFVALALPAHAGAIPPTISSPADGTVSSDASPTVDFTSVDTTATFECAATLGAATPAWTDCSTGWPAPLGADGTYTLSVREKSLDDSGTPATVQYTLDTVADLSVSVAPTSPGNDPSPTWTISAEPGSTRSCTLDAVSVDCTAATFSPGSPLSDGSHDFAVDETDAAGNTTSQTSTYLLDTSAPAAPTAVTGASGTANDTTPTWTWDNPEGVSALCALTGPGQSGTPVACTGTTSETPTLTQEGTYQLTVSLRDAAGNTSSGTTGPDYTLDTTPPGAPVFSAGPTGSDTQPDVSWTFTEPGVSSRCAVVGAQSHTVFDGTCSSPFAYTLPGDDTWTLVVTEDDGVGNTSSATSDAYTLDTTGPAAPGVDVYQAPTGPTNDQTPHITWTGEQPSTAVCRWERTVGSTTTDGTWTDCSSNFYDPTLPGDGSYLFQAQVTDPLGNVGAIGTTTAPYVYDGTAPAPPALTTPGTPNNDPNPTVTFSPEVPGGTAACTFYSGTTSPASPTWTDCTNGTYAPSLPSDGTWTLAVTLSDAAGNTSAPSTFTYVLDRTAPAAVTITGPTGPSNDRKPVWTLAGDPATSITCQILVGNPPSGGTVGTVSSCPTSFQGDLTNEPDGGYTLKVTATSAAHNQTVTTAPYALDTTAPSTPVVSVPAGTGNEPNPTWTFPVQAGTTAQCRLTQGLSSSAWSACDDGTYQVTDIQDGTYTVDVLVTDLAGNAAPIGSSPPYTSDRTAPDAPTVTGPSGPGNSTTPTWRWTGESGATATCRLDRDGVVGSAVPCNSGSFSPALSGDASYVVVVTLTDTAGNQGPPATTPSYDLDTVAPATPTVAGPTGPSSSTTITWSWTAESGATSSCVLVHDGVPGTSAPCRSGTPVPLGGDGRYELDVTVTDAAGNASGLARSPLYTLDTSAPTAPQLITPPSPATDRSPSFSFSGEAGATAECRWRQDTTVVDDWAACTSPYVADLSQAPDADYSLDVRLTDAAGNVGSVGSSLAYRLDTTAPDAPVVAMPSGPSTDRSPVVSWTAEPNTSGTCVLTHDGVAGAPAACATPWSAPLGADGSWSVSVTVTDQAGNTSQPGTAGPYLLDTTPPGAPVLTGPASPGNNATPVWSATLGQGDTAECQTTSGTTVLQAWAACTFPYTTDLTGQPDGTYTLSVRAVDEVSLRSAPVSADYVLDATAPAAPVVTGPASPGNSTALTFRFTAEAGSTTSCTLTTGTTVVSPAAPCTSPVSVDLQGQPDGVYVLSVSATDRAGNTGSTGSATYVLDRVAPDAPVLTTSPATPAPNRSPSWGFTAEAGSTTACTVTGAASGAVSSGPCTSPFTTTLPADDTYTLSVTATDAAGNTSAPLVTTYVLDTTAPAAPVLTGPTSPSQSTSVTWGVRTAEGTVQCQLSFGGSVVVAWTTCTSGFSTTLTGTDGTYQLSARAVDAAGNLSAVTTSTYVLDRTAPGTTLLVTPASPAKDRQPTWTVTGAEAGLTAQCQVSGPGGPLAPSSCSAPTSGAPYTADLTGLPDGSYTLTVVVSDAAGNATSATSAAYVLDTTPPHPVLVTPPPTPGSARSVAWTLVGDSDATLACAFTGPTLPAPTYAPCPGSGQGLGTFTASLATAPDGTYVLTVRATDPAGNVGPEVASSYVLDTTPPLAPAGLRVGHSSPGNAPVVTWSFGMEAGAIGRCQLLSATAIIGDEQSCTSPWQTDLTGLGDGVYTLSVRAQDAAGNLSPAVSADYALDQTPPTAPLVTKTPGSPSPVTTPTWTVEVSDPADVLECQLAGLAGSGWAPCGSTVSYDLSPATSGRYTLQLRETDAAGNVSPVTSASPYLLDSNAPVPPDVSPPALSPGRSLSPVFTISRGKGDTGDTVTLSCAVTRFDGLPASISPCAFGQNTVALPGMVTRSQGPVTLSVTSTDTAGNTSGTASATYLYDGIPPVSAEIRPLADDVGTSPRVTWSFAEPSSGSALRVAALTGQDVVRFRCQLLPAGVAPSGSKSSPCTSPHTELLTRAGSWALWVWAVDQAGNAAPPVSSRYTFVSRVPGVSDLTGPTSGSSRTPSWTFTVPPTYTAHCLLTTDGDALLADVPCSTGRFTANLQHQPYGNYVLTVQLLDGQGFAGPYTPSAPYAFRAASVSPPSVVHSGGGSTPPPPTGTTVAPPPARPSQLQQFADRPARSSAGGIPAKPRSHSSASGSGLAHGSFITPDVPKAIGKTLAQVAQKPTIPLVLLAIVVGFLLIQNRIDRRDPKLASAPVGAEPELEFGPVQAWKGGAPA